MKGLSRIAGLGLEGDLTLLRWMPLIIPILTAIEVVSLLGVGEVKVHGLSGTGWRLLESLRVWFQHARLATASLPLTWYNFVGALGDTKKLVPYGLAWVWFVVFREAPPRR